MTALLELRNVSKIFGGGLFRKKQTVALDQISFKIEADPPAVHAIAGESGSGKSTLGLMLMGFLSPTAGEVLYEGKNIHTLTTAERLQFRRDVQAIFQDPFSVYNPFYKIDHVLEMPISKFKLAQSRAETKALMTDALANVGLRPEETLGKYPHELSGGQRQRIMVARALLMKPRLIIADEPVSMVDASLRATILESLRKLNREFGIAILYITHDLTTAYHVGHDIDILYRGTIAETGTVDQVIKTPQHPYTQLLVNSIPWPDLERRWSKPEAKPAQNGNTRQPNQGCKFAERCPQVMDTCGQAQPALISLEGSHQVACYLYDAAKVTP